MHMEIVMAPKNKKIDIYTPVTPLEENDQKDKVFEQ